MVIRLLKKILVRLRDQSKAQSNAKVSNDYLRFINNEDFMNDESGYFHR